MPKTKLATDADVESFLNVWVRGVRGGKYVGLYARQDKVLVLLPGSSTDPIVYAWMDGIKEDQALKLFEKYRIPAIMAVTWDFEAETKRATMEE